jgi:hypothetical protein
MTHYHTAFLVRDLLKKAARREQVKKLRGLLVERGWLP